MSNHTRTQNLCGSINSIYVHGQRTSNFTIQSQNQAYKLTSVFKDLMVINRHPRLFLRHLFIVYNESKSTQGNSNPKTRLKMFQMDQRHRHARDYIVWTLKTRAEFHVRVSRRIKTRTPRLGHGRVHLVKHCCISSFHPILHGSCLIHQHITYFNLNQENHFNINKHVQERYTLNKMTC